MQSDTFVRFLIATALVTVIPGPNIFLIVNDSIRHGFKKGMHVVWGVTAGMVPLFILSLAGASTLLTRWPWLFDLVRYTGMVYLICLGCTMVLGASTRHRLPRSLQPSQENHFFLRGVLICVTNPKGLLFAGAFFPQFLDKTAPLIPQAAVLCGGCLAVSTLVGMVYAFSAGTAGGLFQSVKFHKCSALVSGILLMLFGISLFFTAGPLLLKPV